MRFTRLQTIFLLLAVCLIPGRTFPQSTSGFHRLNQVFAKAPQGITAQVVPNAKITVTQTSTGGQATIYSDPGLTAQIIPSVVTADGSGNYSYCMANNYCANESISAPGCGAQTYTNFCNNNGGSGSISGQVSGTVGLATSTTATGATSRLSESGGQDVFSQPVVAPSLNAVQLISPTATDLCAAITTALAALPSTGGKIDASGVSSGTNCASTLTINVPSVLIDFGSGVFTLNGNPGISVTSSNVTIAGKGSSQPYNTLLGTTLKSGGAYPLIEDNTNGADNMHIRDLSLNGNSTGTFGVLAPYGAANQYTNLTASGFKYQGVLNTQGVAKLDSVWSNSNGEGGLIASDSTVYGSCEFELNTPGSGLHIIGGGGITSCQSLDHNGFWGLYLDGRKWSDWAASTNYTQYQIIIPTSNNAGGYAFESTVAASSGSSRPIFPQTVGATVADGPQIWVNIGVEVASNVVFFSHLSDIYSNENGQTGSGGDVLVDGGSGSAADHIYLTSIHTAQQVSPTKAVCGTKINHATNVVIHGIGFYGSNFNGNGTDLGALCIVGSSSVEVAGLTSELSATTALSITGSSFDVHVVGASISSVGSSGTPTASTYCAHIDTSFRTIIDDFACLGSTTWAHGIYDLGTNSSISNYKNYTTNAGFSDGAPVNDTFSGSWSNVDENGIVFSSKVPQSCGIITTTAAASDSLACAWVNPASLCTITPSNSTSVAWTYYTPSAGSVTVFHASTAGATYAIACSPN